MPLSSSEGASRTFSSSVVRNSFHVRNKSSVESRYPLSTKKFTVDCHIGPRSRTRARGISLMSQRNSFRPLEIRVFSDCLEVTEGLALGAVARDVAAEAAPVVAGRALAVQFIAKFYSESALAATLWSSLAARPAVTLFGDVSRD